MMKTILGHADVLCKALQQKDQEVVSAVKMVSQTRKLVQTLRDDKWGSFLDEVTAFCKKHGIRIPDFSAPYFEGRSVRNQDNATNEHHYHYDVYNETIDFQLRELDSRFSEKIVELLELSSALDPRDGYISFNSDSILKLAKKYYYLDFTDQELDDLEFQLKHFELDMKDHPKLGKASSIVDLCQGLAYTRKASHYYLVDRLIRLVLTLPVSTASVERAFSAMKIVKNRLRNKMGDVFLSDNLVLYIEKDIAETFSLDSVLDDFSAKKRRVRLI
ncbi:zinc finger MYM-type protein 1-like protein [Tanacetum coccineum]